MVIESRESSNKRIMECDVKNRSISAKCGDYISISRSIYESVIFTVGLESCEFVPILGEYDAMIEVLDKNRGHDYHVLTTSVMTMRTKINISKNGHSILTEFTEGFSTYKVAVPMPLALNYFMEGLIASLSTLSENKEVQAKVSSKQGQKAEIQEKLRHAIKLYESFLEKSGR